MKKTELRRRGMAALLALLLLISLCPAALAGEGDPIHRNPGGAGGLCGPLCL